MRNQEVRDLLEHYEDASDFDVEIFEYNPSKNVLYKGDGTTFDDVVGQREIDCWFTADDGTVLIQVKV